MPSTPPPLPHSPPRWTPWQTSPHPRCSEPSRINWPAILASALVSFALVAGVFVWIVGHPHKAAPPIHLTSVAAVEPLDAQPAPPPARVFAATPAFHRSAPRDAISDKIPFMEVNPPPLPPPASPLPKQHKDHDAESTPPRQQPTPKQPTGETYGTQVLFLNNREIAADTARREHKLLFVMHISGNFEESCFT